MAVYIRDDMSHTCKTDLEKECQPSIFRIEIAFANSNCILLDTDDHRVMPVILQLVHTHTVHTRMST